MLKSNEYFDGKVKSIAFATETLPATVGVMDIGDYDFGTAKRETMTVVSGAFTVKLPGNNDWQTFKAGETFVVPADSRFQVRLEVQSAYLCLYG